jgi:long-chain acyl-CoA synthetase
MALLKENKTIPGLFQFLTEEYKNDKKFLFTKVKGIYEGITYNEFKIETEKFALGLAAIGIKRGDKIAIMAENRPEWVYSDMAILGIGGADVPLYPSLTAESVQFILNNSEAKGIIISNKFQLNKVLKIKSLCRHLNFIIIMNEKDAVPEIQKIYSFKHIQEMGELFGDNHPGYLKESYKQVHENDLCTIIYTSGTTGEPKGVMLSHKNILSNVNAVLETYPITKDDVLLSFLPLCHIFERMAGYYTGFSSGGTIYFAESIEAVPNNIIEVKPTFITTVPRLFERIHAKIMKVVDSQSQKKQKIFNWSIETGKKYMAAKKEKSLSIALSLKRKVADKLVLSNLREKLGGRMRFFISGGAALQKEIGEFFEAIGIIILEGYGLTETSPIISGNRIDKYKFGSVGVLLPNVQVKFGSDGEILASGPNVMLGYYKNKKETEETLKDGWLHTGDIGHFDEEGFLVITERKKHLFKTTSGKYIAPAHIENLFLASKYIDEFVLIGDRRMFLSAIIVPDFGALREYADSHEIDYKNNKDLVNKKEIYDLIDKDMSQFQKKLANYERVRKFTLLDHPFSIETGEITPSLKVKRKFIEEHYGNIIEDMYS